jgi:hypothetical protein
MDEGMSGPEIGASVAAHQTGIQSSVAASSLQRTYPTIGNDTTG